MLDFTIDQSPYLQGFLPALYLYMYKLSGTLLSPAETNTGLKFVTKDPVEPYLTSTRTGSRAARQEQLIKTSDRAAVKLPQGRSRQRACGRRKKRTTRAPAASGSWRDTGVGVSVSAVCCASRAQCRRRDDRPLHLFHRLEARTSPAWTTSATSPTSPRAAAIIAAGEVILLVCGEIDLSVGLTFALTPFIMMAMNDYGIPLFPSLLIALASSPRRSDCSTAWSP